MSSIPNEVPSLIIPLKDKNLLVPNACVAEIIPRTSLTHQTTSYPWMLGEIEWRDLTLPCITFENLSGTENKTEQNSGMSVAIFNTLSDVYPVRFYALSIHGIPRLARVTEEELTENKEEKSAFEKLHVKLNGEFCTIPDLNAVENLLASTI